MTIIVIICNYHYKLKLSIILTIHIDQYFGEYTIISIVCFYQSIKIFRSILHRCNLNLSTPKGINTLMMMAYIEEKDYKEGGKYIDEMVDLMIHKIDLNHKDSNNNDIFYHIIKMGRFRIFQKLFNYVKPLYKSNEDLERWIQSLLTLSYSKKQLDIFDHVLNNSNISIDNRYNWLHQCIQKDDDDFVEILIENQIDIFEPVLTIQGIEGKISPYIEAIKYNSVKTMQTFISYDLMTLQVIVYGIIYASQCRNFEILNIFVKTLCITL